MARRTRPPIVATDPRIAELQAQLDAQSLMYAAAIADLNRLQQEYDALMVKYLLLSSNPQPAPPANVVAQLIVPATTNIEDDDSGLIRTLTVSGGIPNVYTNPALGGADAALFSVAMASDTTIELTLTAPHAADTLEITITVDNDAGTSAPFAHTVEVQAAATPSDPPIPDPDNVMVLTNVSGGTLTNWPLRFGRPFIEGECPDQPSLFVDGVEVDCSVSVHTRWEDGSVKHAGFGGVIAEIVDNVDISFANVPESVGTPLSTAAMLAFDSGAFDAKVKFTKDGTTHTISARTMLTAEHYTVWLAGDPCTEIILADHSTAHAYDVGFTAFVPLRTIFHATFFPDTDQIKVRAIVEISNTEEQQDVLCDIEVLNGATSIYSQSNVNHKCGTRWTREFWIGGTPDARVNVAHNLDYLSATRQMHPYDANIVMPESAIASAYSSFQALSTAIGSNVGLQKNMGTTGGRQDIGISTGNVMKWMMSRGDWRMLAYVKAQADAGGAWSCHVREGDTAKLYDEAQAISAVGLPISVYARPTAWVYDTRAGNAAADVVTVNLPRTASTGYVFDAAHQPELYYEPYMLTDDYFYLEQLQFWAAFGVVRINPNNKSSNGTTPSGVIRDQVRGEAWTFRTRMNAAVASPDDTPEKTYFADLCDHATAFWEGRFGITGTEFEGTTFWAWGADNSLENPLHFWAQQVESSSYLVPGTWSTRGAMWQNYFITVVLGRARERGLPVSDLHSWISRLLIAQYEQTGDYNFLNLNRYQTGVKDPGGEFFPTWADTEVCYSGVPGNFNNDVGDGYWMYAYAASTTLTDETNGSDTYNWLKTNAYDAKASLVRNNPKWAFRPPDA